MNPRHSRPGDAKGDYLPEQDPAGHRGLRGSRAYSTRRAVELADTTGSELHVVYVGRLPNFLMKDPDVMDFNRKLYDDIERESLEMLWRLTWQVKASGGTVAGAHLRIGIVAEEIVKSAKDLEADPIVMGTGSHGGLRRAIEGSISDVVIRRAPCAVMTVRSEVGEKHRGFWRRIFSSGSEIIG
jgi:nucleotide-binding universal stress UspA family protein